NKHKILPHGPPEMIMRRPDRYHPVDFKVIVPEDIFNSIKEEFAPQGHPVFQLVPPVFEAKITRVYTELESPTVTSNT
ncbi:hypothetical protein BV25DRAFT_1779534, partial [Artomyces pyxidatus]